MVTRVLLTAAAYEVSRDLLADLGDDVELLLASAENAEALATASFDVAWLSGDLFGGGRGAAWFAPLLSNDALRWVHSSTAGVDTPLFQAMLRRGVRVTSAHIYGIPISEYVLRCALEHVHRPERWRAAQAEARWAPDDVGELAGTTWLIVGVGDIGGAVAARASAFGVHTIGATRSRLTGATDETIGPDDILGRLPEADVVVLARPGGVGEPPVVDTTFVAAMKPGSLLVNVSRGSLVDESALIDGLDEGRPGRAVLDVMEEEPLPPEHPLWRHPGVVLTPHVSGQGTGRYRRGAAAFVENLRRYVGGQPLLHEAQP